MVLWFWYCTVDFNEEVDNQKEAEWSDLARNTFDTHLRRWNLVSVKQLEVALCLHATFRSAKPVRNHLERWFDEETDF